MNKILLPIVALFIFAVSCKKTDSCTIPFTTASVSETNNVATYLSTNGLTAVKDYRGFYYSISNAGSTSHPTLCSTVNVKYTGKLTNGNVFD